MKQFTLVVLAAIVSSTMGFDPVTLTVGTTAYVLTAAQATLGVAALAGLAIAKEKLILSSLSRGKRDLNSHPETNSANLDRFFWAIGESDASDCGKFLVCNIMATPQGELKEEEELIARLFDDDNQINPNSYKAAYQFAAYVGSLRQPELCKERYAKCEVPLQHLQKIVEVHAGGH